MLRYNQIYTLLFLLLLNENYIIFAVFKKHFCTINVLYYFTIYQSTLIFLLRYTNRITYHLFFFDFQLELMVVL
jgi:hypothetical protein